MYAQRPCRKRIDLPLHRSAVILCIDAARCPSAAYVRSRLTTTRSWLGRHWRRQQGIRRTLSVRVLCHQPQHTARTTPEW